MRRLAAAVFFLALPSLAQLAPPSQLGISMGHVHFNVSDPEAHRQLWIEHFDAKPLDRKGLTGVKIPGTVLLFREQQPTGTSVGSVIDHFGLKVQSRDAILEAWRAAGMEVEFEFTGAAGFPNAYILAPDGIRLELQEDVEQPEKAIAHHVHYYKRDHQDIRSWYINTFDAVPSNRGRVDTADVPGINLSFTTPRRPGPPRAPTRGRAIDHYGFEVDDLKALCEHLEARGIRFDVPYRELPELGLAIAFFTDPSGAYIELTQGLDQY